MLLSKKAILESHDVVTKDIPVPEWGGTVRVRTMDGWTRDRYEATLSKDKGGLENVRARLVALCVVDEEGKLVFDASDVAVLGRKSSKALDRVFAECLKLNGFTAEDVETLAKN